ncbi:TIGR01777 family oxidoreductase [Pontibacter sp. JAM-7]|uniref:TIGR01777 family oxidoreductase n=1 Tax=Pontibacter sp. JAM-7 TaxID=3366581 RepID=UPI003AF4663A
MHILVTGGTGFIGQQLVRQRLAKGDQVTCLTRQASQVAKLFKGQVTGVEALAEVVAPVDAVVNLAGAPIADRRWSNARKQLLRESRIALTNQLVRWIGQLTEPPAVLISGSAIGFYGSQITDQPLNEQAEVQPGFTHQLCADWEDAAQQASEYGVRVCLIRTGVVLGKGGALAKMLPAFKLGLGGPIGSGKQWMSWIAIDDHLRAMNFLLEQPDARGAYNLTAPEAVPNAVFAATLGQVLKRPTLMRVPSFVINLMLGDGAELLLEGQCVYPQRLLDAGFKFNQPELRGALQQALN